MIIPQSTGLIYPRGGEPWDISSASYSQTFSVSGNMTSPRGLFLKPDGLKMYLTDQTVRDVTQYDLSTAWDISSATYVQEFSVSAQESSPLGVFFKDDGTKMYVVGSSGDEVNEYSLSAAWDISTASYVRNFSGASEDTSLYCVFFKPDGLKMYFAGGQNQSVYEYNLSTSWDVSTASYLQTFSVSAQESVPLGLFFKPDGLKMYVSGQGSDNVNEYDLSTAWDISSASYLQNISVAAQDSSPSGVSFKGDGTKMYVVGSSGDEVNEYDLG